MIVGVGIDLVDVARIEATWKRHGDRFLKRILLASEIDYCLSHKCPAPFIAARFAAKEAISKAFGTGIGATLGWHDMEVRRRDSGQPYVIAHGKAAELMAAHKANQIHISITHTATQAIVVAILEQVDRLTGA